MPANSSNQPALLTHMAVAGYRSLGLIATAARGDLVAALAAEGGGGPCRGPDRRPGGHSRLPAAAAGAAAGGHAAAGTDSAGAGCLALAGVMLRMWVLAYILTVGTSPRRQR